MIAAIVAVDKNWGIGFNGDLLEHIPEDLKYFKTVTDGHTIIMGRKTWDSLPKKPLPGRTNIVISSTLPEQVWSGVRYCPLCVMSMEKCVAMLQNLEEDIFIIGGGEIYKQLLPYCDRVYVTKIEKSHKDIDTYFPNLDKDPEWEVSTCTELRDYKDIPYAFLTYDRIS